MICAFLLGDRPSVPKLRRLRLGTRRRSGGRVRFNCTTVRVFDLLVVLAGIVVVGVVIVLSRSSATRWLRAAAFHFV